MSDETRLIHTPRRDGPISPTVGPPVQRGSTILLPNAAALYDDENYLTYGRTGLAAQVALQDGLKALEHADEVALYPSGVAAISGALLAVLKAGDEVLVTDSAYKPTRRFCDSVLRRFGVTVRYFEPRTSPDALVSEAPDAVRLILLESPGSLSFEMPDTPRIAALARARGILTAIDNTWGAGLLFRPLDHGVDISIQSLTKYVSGHSDVFMGSAATRDQGIARKLREGVTQMGWAVSGDDAYLMLRGLRTLPVRLQRHGENGVAVATWLAQQPEVQEMFHPALPSHPDHDIWARDFSGACGLFAFTLKPAPEAAVEALLDSLKLFGLGFSWGGFESLALACDPQLSVRKIAKRYSGPLIRLHVGLEDPADLIADLRTGLDAYGRLAG